MDNSLAEVFDRHFEKVKFDMKLMKSVNEFHIYMSTMSPDHIQFFGSNLLGVNTLRFLPRDIRRFYDYILHVDYALLEKDIRKLTTFYQDNSISGDVFNLTLFYMIHRFYNTTHLSEKDRMKAAHDTALIFCYRCVFALTNNYFPIATADPKIAQAAYANLSNKHLIKKLGTWNKLCDYRATRIVEKTTKEGQPGLNYARLVMFNDDIEITDIIQDSQNRFRSIFYLYYSEFDKVHKDGSSIAVTSATITDADGDLVLLERTKGPDAMVSYARSLINDGNGFIDNDLITVIADINGNTSVRMIRSTLEWMTTAYHDPKWNASIDKFVADVVVQGLYYLEHNIPLNKRKDLSYILITLKNLFLSTRSTDPQLISIRAQGEKIVMANNKGISKSLMMATRSAILLYVILRVFTGSKGR